MKNTDLKTSLVELIGVYGICALARTLHQIAIESENEISPKTHDTFSINIHRIVALHLSGALDEMDEVLRENKQ